VQKEFNHVATALKPHSVGLLHGQLPAPEQERVISAFRSGALKVLLATSLIEVGLDVSNATVMLVENAERFGLAQLHQLRGRIGRGTHTSYCVLVTADKNPEMLERLTILGETSDGFKIAEADLQLRGPGELLGQEQSGLPSFRFADLKRDFDLLAQALPVSLKLVQGR